MKIRDLIKLTGAPKQTIHYYVRYGLLPKPRKLGPNSAEYSSVHVDRIRLIKELQDNYFLPLSVIKKILKKYEREPEAQAAWRIRVEYYRPLEQLLAGHVAGRETFLEATGLRAERLAQYEAWGLISPETAGGQEVYSYSDLVIGKTIAQFRSIGMTAEKGYEPDLLKDVMDSLREFVGRGMEYLFEPAAENMAPDEFKQFAGLAMEIAAVFHFHLYRRLAREALERKLNRPSD